jgi:hypothetical protein
MEVELFIRDKELGIEFEMKFDSMDALSDQVFNITSIVDKAKRIKVNADMKVAALKKVNDEAAKVQPKPATDTTFE